MASESLARLHLLITGRVQGVFFRASAANQARSLGIRGFACNLAEGSVEIVAEGARSSLELLRAWAERGPAHAEVDSVEAEWGDFKGEFSEFRIR